MLFVFYLRIEHIIMSQLASIIVASTVIYKAAKIPLIVSLG